MMQSSKSSEVVTEVASWPARMRRYIASRWLYVVYGPPLLVSVLVVMGTVPEEIPRSVQMSSVGFVGASALAFYPVKRIVEYLHQRTAQRVLLVDDNHETLGLLSFGPGAFSRVVWEDEPEVRRSSEGPIHVGKNFRWETREVLDEKNGELVEKPVPVIDGTWMGVASNLEMMEQKIKIDEIHNVLEKFGKWGLTARLQAGSAVREGTARNTIEIERAVEAATMFRGEVVDETWNEVIGGLDSGLDELKEDRKVPDRETDDDDDDEGMDIDQLDVEFPEVPADD